METIGANIFVETVYPGINVGCIITDEGAICVDTPLLPGEAQRWMARIESLGAEQVRFVVYTSGQSERILGTQYFISEKQVPLPPQQISAQRVTRPRPLPFRQPAPMLTPEQSRWVQLGAVVAHKSAWQKVKEHQTDSFKQSMVDMFGERDPDMVKLDVTLPQITFDDRIKLYVGDVTVELLAAADAVLWVWLLEQRVLFTGDTVVVGVHPPLTDIDLPAWLNALERLCQDPRFQDTIIVPGRGPLSDVSAVEPLVEYLRIACSRTEEIYAEGRPKAELNEVAAKLLPLYPVADGQRERVQRQIKLGLDNLYDVLKAADAAIE
jgi:glyoxylase-like metal-dependent hydrolase (beta-lactamase superfamily II)